MFLYLMNSQPFYAVKNLYQPISIPIPILPHHWKYLCTKLFHQGTANDERWR